MLFKPNLPSLSLSSFLIGAIDLDWNIVMKGCTILNEVTQLKTTFLATPVKHYKSIRDSLRASHKLAHRPSGRKCFPQARQSPALRP
jgi:hypothetical protein